MRQLLLYRAIIEGLATWDVSLNAFWCRGFRYRCAIDSSGFPEISESANDALITAFKIKAEGIR